MAGMFGGRVYTVQFSGVAATAQQDFFEVVAAAAKPLYLIGLELSQTSEAGDSAEEQLLVQIKSGQTTSGSGGSAGTAVAQNESDAAAGFTAEVNNTTKASAGTIRTHHSSAWNVRVPYLWTPTPAQVVCLTGGRRGTVELGTTPADSVTVNGTLYVEEVG